MACLCLYGAWASSSALDGGRRQHRSRRPAARAHARAEGRRDAGGRERRRNAWLGDDDGGHGRADHDARLRRKSPDAGSDDESSAGSGKREEVIEEEVQEIEDDGGEDGWTSAEGLDERRPRVLLLHFEEPSVDVPVRRQGTGDDEPSGSGSGSGSVSGSSSEQYFVVGPDPRFVPYRDLLLLRAHRLPVHADAEPSFPSDDGGGSHKGQEDAKKSKKYGRALREPLETEECRPRHDWQKGAFPNCNIL